MDKNVCVHTGHRKRMRSRFMRDGNFDNFEYHEILEMLLYYSVKRADTNALAHKMINSFGSFHALLDASVQEIMDTCGVSESTAFIVGMIPHLAKRYMDSRNEEYYVINSKNDAFRLLQPMSMGEIRERLYLVCLDGSHKVIKLTQMAQGTVNGTSVQVDRLLEILIKHKAAYAIIAHNHPGNTMKPSSDDIAATNKIKNAFDIINVILLDHIILCGDKCYSFAQNRLCGLEY